ncbi:unnamed protein product [Linum tenue]|uniref:Uncharacterized protein n=1 Tax=Linum tenue TaxID=586396 RepID=A0AAV0QW08_9ROSI|nr:unnamed protein product [Linum tenue]
MVALLVASFTTIVSRITILLIRFRQSRPISTAATLLIQEESDYDTESKSGSESEFSDEETDEEFEEEEVDSDGDEDFSVRGSLKFKRRLQRQSSSIGDFFLLAEIRERDDEQRGQALGQFGPWNGGRGESAVDLRGRERDALPRGGGFGAGGDSVGGDEHGGGPTEGVGQSGRVPDPADAGGVAAEAGEDRRRQRRRVFGEGVRQGGG